MEDQKWAPTKKPYVGAVESLLELLMLMVRLVTTADVPLVKKHDAIKQNVPPPPSEHLRGKNASIRWHILKKRAIIKEVNVQQTYYAAFDWTVPLEKAGLMKSVTQMEFFLVGAIYNFYSNFIPANSDPNITAGDRRLEAGAVISFSSKFH
ncbi:hypothetical protein ACFE04_021129 [Oxalis oulophora]